MVCDSGNERSERFKVEVMIRACSHITQPPVRVRKKELFVTSKYENLVYSSELEVVCCT